MAGTTKWLRMGANVAAPIKDKALVVPTGTAGGCSTRPVKSNVSEFTQKYWTMPEHSRATALIQLGCACPLRYSNSSV